MLAGLKLMESSFWEHCSSSQQNHKMSSHFELAVSAPWVCNSHCELAVSYLFDHLLSSSCSISSELLCEWRTHRKFTASSKCELILWVHCELTKCPQNELSMSFIVSWQGVSCELEFFTGWDHIHQVRCSYYVAWNFHEVCVNRVLNISPNVRNFLSRTVILTTSQISWFWIWAPMTHPVQGQKATL